MDLFAKNRAVKRFRELLMNRIEYFDKVAIDWEWQFSGPLDYSSSSAPPNRLMDKSEEQAFEHGIRYGLSHALVFLDDALRGDNLDHYLLDVSEAAIEKAKKSGEKEKKRKARDLEAMRPQDD